MSITAVQAFIDASKRPENREAWAAHLRPGTAIDEPGLVELARQCGYDFSLDELLTHMRAQVEQVAGRLDDEELTDDELERVAGGSTGNHICAVWYHWPCN